jgi:hypothetical protein
MDVSRFVGRTRAARAGALGLFFVLSACLGQLWYFLYWRRTLPLDWSYFDSLGRIVASNVWVYHRFPLHDPWMCGGLDLLANPQNRIFSPFGLLDLFLPAHVANVTSLLIYAVLGQLGFYLFLRALGRSRVTAAVGAVLFVNCSWFGLRLAEGHVPIASVQMLGWVGWCAVALERPRSQVLLCGLLALFLLDGGIYAFLWSLYLLLSLATVFPARAAAKVRCIVARPWPLVAAGVAAALLASAKVVPVLVVLPHRVPVLENYRVSSRTLAHILFDPWQDLRTTLVDPATPLRFHEFGCYVGVLSLVILVVAALGSRELVRQHGRFALPLLFWAWTALGWGAPLNPWNLLQRIPLVNQAHVQSRLLVLSFLFYVVLLTAALDRLRAPATPARRALFALACVLLCAEYVAVKNIPAAAIYAEFSVPTGRYPGLIHNTNLDETIARGEKPEHYFDRNKGSRWCYEPAKPRTQVRSSDDPGYRGEAYFLRREGEATLVSYTPGRIALAYRRSDDASAAASIRINTNALAGWRVAGGRGTVERDRERLVQVRVDERAGDVVLEYAPGYFPLVLALYGLGWVVGGVAVLAACRSRAGAEVETLAQAG